MADEMLRVVEFYSGIGGMHFALKGCRFSGKVFAALEINTTANQVYQLNFGDTKLLQKNIEGLTVQDLDGLSPDVFLMSPPCQPFTRVGLQGASKDPRTRSFLHILELLPQLSRSPNYILMENVKGFETSDTREQFLHTLKACGYSYQEFLLSPTQLGIPNSRLRYYLLAKKKPLQFHFATRDEIMESFPYMITRDKCDNQCSDCGRDCVAEPGCTTNEVKPTGLLPASDCTVDSTHRDRHNTGCLKCLQAKVNVELKPVLDKYNPTNCRKIGDYLEKDIVNRQSARSCCFTKAYGHYAEGTGSVLKMADIDDTEIFERYRDLTDDQSKLELLSVLKLRYFTPREVANLHGFPSDFCFPTSVSVKQQYRLLGNSLNVHVVSELLNCLFQSPT
ncbi:tRNA (cytosine-5-)-methyltransferase-like isoform X2 [Orbicella faveolata]|uniref:tRNA (cytosine-5-)-methyltransferase-like isoform X2 n=1 Tax=Orbicella faveolata TaxID=48498 RepID=UPI0009E470CF|nr:tRNA (cytosine-5-)-methyltransferase-like isoform X2 [Orbicella faveolata]